ncbi:MAG: hypothetical protein IPI58_05905 [Alphaproteobacteria bacterium]|nr:MAG: hypothetical protein IPI58_05905 [Alphaproteobacteria bacterium]
MGKQLDLYRKWKKAKSQLEEIATSAETAVVIHYSCESFYDRTVPESPRITSIAVRNLDTGQTKSFSIHLMAERQNKLTSIEEHYNSLERSMLEEFYEHAKTLQHYKWIHWNMRDANYGFEALEHRLKVLGGVPFHIDERNRFDLSRILVSLFGVGYIGHPRLEKLINLNKITSQNILTGKEEAEAFVQKQFVRLHQSTLRKVDVLANITDRTHHNELKTLATWWAQHGRSFKAIIEWLKEHWLISAISVLTTTGIIMFKAWNLLGLFVHS